MHILSPETDNCPSWISGRERITAQNISWSISTKECCRPRRGLNPRPPGLQSDGASNWATEAGRHCWVAILVYYLINLACLINLIHSIYIQPNEPVLRDPSFPIFLWRLSFFYFLLLIELVCFYIYLFYLFILYHNHMNILDVFTLRAVYYVALDSCLAAFARPRQDSSLGTTPHIIINWPWKAMEVHN